MLGDESLLFHNNLPICDMILTICNIIPNLVVRTKHVIIPLAWPNPKDEERKGPRAITYERKTNQRKERANDHIQLADCTSRMSVGLVQEAEVCAGSIGSLLMVSEIAESVRAMRVR